MKVTGPLFKWFGSKWTIGAHYDTPLHDTIVEPYAGGAGYALRYHNKRVRIAEKDPHIALLWQWLIKDASPWDILQIPLDVPEGTDIRTLGLSEGQATLLKSWQRTNSVGNCWTISAWGSKPGQWTANTRARVAEESQAVKHWEFFGSAEDVLRDNICATWFIDPPYKYNYQYRQSPVDYTGLAATAMGLRGQVILCEARDPKTEEVPTYLPFRDFRRSVTSRRAEGNHTHSSELVWTNDRVETPTLLERLRLKMGG